MNPDPVDRLLLQLLQDDFPLEADAWGALGQQVSIGGEEVLNRVRSLQASGILRGICPILESGKTGIGASTLVALRLPPDKVEEMARFINSFPQVSHNYLRNHQFNLWFTVGARDREELEQLLQVIRDRCCPNSSDMIELPVKRRFKIDVRFPLIQQKEIP
jgi:DNA-binding Lrp family transcriptional regulator